MKAIIVLLAVVLFLLPVHLSAQCTGCQDLGTRTGDADSRYGFSVAVIGDINKDGIADFIVGAPNDAGPMGRPEDGGTAWVYSGADPLGDPLMNFSTLYIEIGQPNGMLGFCVSGAGDVNGDGIPDMIIGEPHYRVDGGLDKPTGRALVYSGNMDDGYPNLYFPDTLITWDFRVGFSVACAGDVNNDGRDDIIVGAPRDGTDDDFGRAFVYALLDNNGNNVWTQLYEKSGENYVDKFGKTVSGAGDVNNDEHDDFMVYSWHEQGRGEVYVYSGKDGTELHMIPGMIIDGDFGRRMAPLGDIDNDEYDDFIIADAVGHVYLYSGQTGERKHTFTTGSPSNLSFGDDIASAGDFNNDTKMDILIGCGDFSRLFVYSGETYELLAYIDCAGDSCGKAVAGPLVTLSDGYNITIGGSPSSDNVSVLACGYPVADFEGEPQFGEVPLTVSFTDLSSADITDWSWDFGDGEFSTEENPVHEYTYVGTYTVSLTVTGRLNCTDARTIDDYIEVVYPQPIAEFTGEPLSGIAPLEVIFTNQSINHIPDSSYWTFGDGEYAEGENTTHRYTLPGAYTVSLSVLGLNGEYDEETKTDYITVTLAPGPELWGPSNGYVWAANSTGEVAVFWHSVENMPYQIWIDDDSTFSGLIDRVGQVTAGDTFAYWDPQDTLTAGVWFWKVRGFENGENGEPWSEWSETWHYILVDPPPAPTLVEPDNGQTWTTSGMHVTLAWNELPYIINYRVLVDNNSDFSSPIADTTVIDTTWLTPSYSPGTFHWKVMATNVAGEGPWSDVRWFKLIRSNPSCPVLFTWDGDRYVEKNTLLTACEESGYRDIVTDYYHITGDISDRDGMVSFQIREMEHEITYLYDVELISVTHSKETRIACSVDGAIAAYQETRAPISAVDHNGNDCLDLLLAKDGEKFTSDGPGHLIVKFSSIGDGESGLNILSGEKPNPCNDPIDDKVLASSGNDVLEGQDLVIEILAGDGSWVQLSTIPMRDRAIDEFILADFDAIAGGDLITLRVSWEKGYSADILGQIIPAAEDPICRVHEIDRSDVLQNDGSGVVWTKFDGSTPLILRMGDALEFSFTVDLPGQSELIQDYIIRATGRYEPDDSPRAEVVSDQFNLRGNYPNPFNPVTTISYDLPSAARVNITIFDVTGRLIAVIVDEVQDRGHHEVIWDGTDRNGHAVASGAYFYRFTADSFVETKKMMLLR